MHDEDAAPDNLYTDAVGDDPDKAKDSEAEQGAVESNSSNYGGSALADKPIEDRVLHRPQPGKD